MRSAFTLALVSAFLCGTAPALHAQSASPEDGLEQPAATLIADSVALDGNNVVRARGNVEVFYEDAQLKASGITYDATTEKLTIEGPITVYYGDTATLLASAAEMDAELRNGLLKSARLVLDQQLQLAAAEVRRIDGRYTRLGNTVASSCKVCAADPVPLWQIRAREVIHDELERQLYFTDARLEVAGVPIAYLPRLRLPDPTLERANGFLIPTIRSDSIVGQGIELPYFLAIGEDKDLTISPLITTNTRTLQFRYRQALNAGDIEVNGAITRDDIRPGDWRGYLFADGSIGLRNDFVFNFDIEITSDKAYLLEYDYSDTDRLESTVELARTRRDTYFSTNYTHYRSLRDSEQNDEIPTEVVELTYERRFTPSLFGGTLTTAFDGQGFMRTSDTDGPTGRDMARASLQMDWQRTWDLNNGMLVKAIGAANADYYLVNQDSSYDEAQLHLTPTAGVELRWPFMKSESSGVVHSLEPVAQLLWTDTSAADVPNEVSTRVEFDEGNLFSLSRFPGFDRYERGFRANIGANWTRYDPDGWTLGVTVGKIFRDTDVNGFSTGSGLSGTESDWLAAASVTFPNNLSLINRALFNSAFEFTKNETRVSWVNDDVLLSSSYVWMVEDASQSRFDDTSEWTMDAEYRFARNWIGKVDWRYDFVEGSAARAGVGLEYVNECISVDLSLSRRFTSSSNVDPSTSVGLQVTLLGFGENNRRQSVRECY
ncbi:LPS-assembly protein LptD precursor [Pseudoruegeria aquimaris]|uniref:LPS-assembly protein LptD n=1 Tax=Pseudoruegeria aquimaris TaxID=393663 RepID=A0A1Y5R7T4_9RHOB|nr:LPS assembly protein LptD [Pseudoruegeria aquimaris]SLN11157.1 LPS-assembly protein LptD precursor [Pseudoruegeria aquimaris]